MLRERTTRPVSVRVIRSALGWSFMARPTLLALTSANRALLGRWAGAPLGGLPAPIDLDAAGLKLDAYLKDRTS